MEYISGGKIILNRIYLLSKNYKKDHIFVGKIIKWNISLKERLQNGIYLWNKDFTREYIFGAKITITEISFE